MLCATGCEQLGIHGGNQVLNTYSGFLMGLLSPNRSQELKPLLQEFCQAMHGGDYQGKLRDRGAASTPPQSTSVCTTSKIPPCYFTSSLL